MGRNPPTRWDTVSTDGFGGQLNFLGQPPPFLSFSQYFRAFVEFRRPCVKIKICPKPFPFLSKDIFKEKKTRDSIVPTTCETCFIFCLENEWFTSKFNANIVTFSLLANFDHEKL